MYACIVKNNSNTWDIFTVFPSIPDAKKQRIDSALESGLPIVSRNLTEFGSSVRSGAIWDGAQFNGGIVKRPIFLSVQRYDYLYITYTT